jgi:photosystem II stability/assembly factor-like uncharacterized protein
MRRLFWLAFSAGLALGSFASAASPAAAAPAHVDAPYFDSLSWRLIGPFRGGRAIAVAGVPGEPDHYYFGAVDGGVWETTNAGRTWQPIFDGQDVGSIGALAVAPSDSKTLYVGSGEADMRSDIAYGNGMYKSTDGGKTWQHIGLENTYQIGAIVVDPRNAEVAYVAALGHAYAANPDRGVFKTTDGGATWNKVLFKNDDAGAISLALDPKNPDTIYASLWQTRRPPWNVYPPSNGPGSGLYKSTDGGRTWTQLTNGLPEKVGRIGIAVAPTQPSRVYAQIDSSELAKGGIYRSDDGGATWTHLAGGLEQVRLWGRGWYFSGITVDTKNPDVLYVMNTATYRSEDGGKTFVPIKGSPGGDDYHTLWINPNDPTHMVLGSDQGVIVSSDRAKTWSSWYNQPTAQMYHAIADNRFPYWVYGAQQDSGAMAVPSQTIHQSITSLDWRPMNVSGENGYVAPDPDRPGYLFGSGGSATYEDLATGWEQNVDPTTAAPPDIYRQTWTMPIVISQADKALYTSRQQVFRSTDRGHSWKIISPDLSRNDPSEDSLANLDATTNADNLGIPRRGVVYAIAPSPLSAATIWAGTDDGYVWRTADGGAHWTNVTPKGLTPWSKVGIIDASHLDANAAYIAVDRHRLDDYTPYIYKTSDGGKSWSLIAKGIPQGSFVNVVRADPKVRGLLYAGTEKGAYVSFDDGANWQSLQRNLPVTSIRDIDVHANDLVIATHGRSFWIMDDIEPLREMARATASTASAYLFSPVTTPRFRRAGGVGGGIPDEGTPIQKDEPTAPNPPLGVYIDYYLAAAATTPVKLDIVGPLGNVVRSFASTDTVTPPDISQLDIDPVWVPAPMTVSTGAGAHRFVWDFTTRHDGGPLAPPGTYTVRLTANGSTISRTFDLVRDPRINVTDKALWAQYQLSNAIEESLARIKATREHAEAVLKAGNISADNKRILEEQVLGMRGAENPDNSVGSPVRDFTSLRALQGALENLEAAVQNADAGPTKDQTAGYVQLQHLLSETIVKLARIAGPQ